MTLLPSSSDLYERAFEASLQPRWNELNLAAEAIRTVKFNPPPSFLPFLVFEYGLGELTPYVPNLYTLVVDREGVNWQRIRGTPASVYKGLGWLGYTATLEDAWHGRAYWNSTQLRFSALPDADFPDLERIEGVTRLSLPKRSDLRRGVYQYDIGATESDGSVLDGSMLDTESGIAVTDAGTLWSFGRVTEVDHLLTEAEGLAIGNWLEEPEGGGIKWTSLQYPWVQAQFKWADSATNMRRSLMAGWFSGRQLFATFRDTSGNLLGHRRCRAVHPVSQKLNGPYEVGNINYVPAAGGRRLYVEAMTDVNDAWDVTAASVEITVGAEIAVGINPGQLWLQPGQLIGGEPIAHTAIHLPLRRTVRDQVKFIVRF
ncbi:phage tail protein [Neorhizobium sp. T786]|uniref:phage tail protein n=1 Tax=Pseudorhizobium xiangyangii TaxID=2883104 RepID=UPI001CFFF0BD|nr:phage tail protein [Neorhizobium xiangyangii]MCB5204257.1 phage tail protein [Neorhizobium xiangyangii]